MKKILLLLLLIIPMVQASDQWDCMYANSDDNLYIKILNKSDYYQCPPVLKEFSRLELQENHIDYTPPEIYQSGGGGSTLSFKYTPVYNESCVHRCDECYEEGSILWVECVGKSKDDNQDTSSINLETFFEYVFILMILLIGVLIGTSLPHKKIK